MEIFLGDVFNAYQMGAQADLRVRLALELLKDNADRLLAEASDIALPVRYDDQGMRISDDKTPDEKAELIARTVAKIALGITTEIVNQAHAEGLIKHLPEDGNLNAALRHHLDRQGNAQAYANKAMERGQREAGPRLQAVPPLAS